MDAEIYTQLKHTVKSLLDIDLNSYKDEQMKRRLDSWLTRSGEPSWHDYFKRVRSDLDEKSRFRNYLTINVSAFFRDPERWADLREKVLPHLLASPLTSLRVWSAGCSIGPEPYTLAILFDEMRLRRQTYLLATDLDRGALAKAQARGPFTADDLRNATPQQIEHYFESTAPPFYVSASLAKRVTFCEHNMLADDFESDFDLIVCRNVVIYFTEAAKSTLYRKFCGALKPGGVLFVGGTEIIPRYHEMGFRNFGLSFYQKM
jgi:chemotaxis protein methyltransferase CheR